MAKEAAVLAVNRGLILRVELPTTEAWMKRVRLLLDSGLLMSSF